MKNAQRRMIMGVGSANIDIVYRANRIAREEEKTYIAPDESGRLAQEIVGGVTLNHLSWAAALGAPAGYFGYLGDDRNGDLLREAMDARGIDRRHLRIRRGASSGTAVIFVDANGERAIYMSGGTTADISADHVERDFAEAIQQASIVSSEASLISLRGVAAAFQTAKRAGILTALDVDAPPSACAEAGLGTRAELEQALSLADIVKPSKAAAAELSSAPTLERQAEETREQFGAKLVAVTNGARGSVLSNAEQTLRFPAASVEAVDTTGAGDAFFGGLLAGHALPLEERGRLANACGAACCAVLGAPPLPGESLKLVKRLYGGPIPL